PELLAYFQVLSDVVRTGAPFLYTFNVPARSMHAVILSPATKIVGTEATYPDHTPSVTVLTPTRPLDTTVTWIRELFGWPRNVTDWPDTLVPTNVLIVACTYCVGGSVRL